MKQIEDRKKALKDILQKVQSVQMTTLGILEMTIETGECMSMPKQWFVQVSVQRHGDMLSCRHFCFFSWQLPSRQENEMEELKQHVTFLMQQN